MMWIPGELVRAVRNRRIVPFVGAGVSMGVKPGLFVSWGQLIEQLAAIIEEDGGADGADVAAQVRRLRDWGDHPQAAEVAYRKLGGFRFNRALRVGFHVPQPADGDLSVPVALWKLRPPLVITTNYNQVLRWTCPAHASIVANDQSAELGLLDDDKSSDSPWIWHLHGTIERLDTIILAGNNYRRLYGDDDPQRRALNYDNALLHLRSTMAVSPLLYVGFSLNDPYVLQQIKLVLRLTDGKGPPSYALMKQGEGDAAALWSSYNIQLIEYADHGQPLAELLREIAARAFGAGALPDGAGRGSLGGPALSPTSAPSPPGAPLSAVFHGSTAVSADSSAPPAPPRRPLMPRPALEGEYLQILRSDRRLLVLAPHRGGARTLAAMLEERSFGRRVTRLSPPNVPRCTVEEYFRELSGQGNHRSPVDLVEWLEARAEQASGDHLIVLENDGGPLDHLVTLATSLRKLLDEGKYPFFFLVAGAAALARLRHLKIHSLFSGAPFRRVPPLTVGEVGAMLATAGLDAGRAAVVHVATGGLPGLVDEVIADGLIDAAAITRRLAQSPSVRGVLLARLSEDDRSPFQEAQHARSVLEKLLAGEAVRTIADGNDHLEYPEVRLYYDGLVAEQGPAGTTVFRCEAVRLAAERALGAPTRPEATT